MDPIAIVESRERKSQWPDFRSGDTVRVSVKVKEGDKERIQVFQGVVISLRRGSLRSTFTVRKVTDGVGVERIFPFHSPTISKIEVVSHGRTRRARLYYLRELRGKAARLKRRTTGAQGEAS
ncbi:MAG TPA: 50S ribosomal protein L19 [Candidatus Saccharimonadales bacterium]|nr:50S ribosomal protein L19 [Candidatus Saccharimonadales bacterium]